MNIKCFPPNLFPVTGFPGRQVYSYTLEIFGACLLYVGKSCSQNLGDHLYFTYITPDPGFLFFYVGAQHLGGLVPRFVEEVQARQAIEVGPR